MNTNLKRSKFLQAVGGLILALAATCASAIPVIFFDKADPNPDKLIAFGNHVSFSFMHSVVSDQDGAGAFWSGDYGFNSATDTITSTSLVLRFADETNDTAPESVAFLFDSQNFGTQTITSGGATFTATFATGFGTLLNDGLLSVILSNAGTTSGHQADRSDFFFLDSTLTVIADRAEPAQVSAFALAPLAVPEPGSLALIGFGLAGLAFSRRRKGSK